MIYIKKITSKDSWKGADIFPKQPSKSLVAFDFKSVLWLFGEIKRSKEVKVQKIEESIVK